MGSWALVDLKAFKNGCCLRYPPDGCSPGWPGGDDVEMTSARLHPNGGFDNKFRVSCVSIPSPLSGRKCGVPQLRDHNALRNNVLPYFSYVAYNSIHKLRIKKKLKKTPVRGSKKQTSFHNTGPG